jgi:predicted SAM-dependent methyltransferase
MFKIKNARLRKKISSFIAHTQILNYFANKSLLKKYFKENKIRKLQLGSGAGKLDGWLNSDIKKHDFDYFQLDITQERFPFNNQSFDYIFTEHMIEHVKFEHGVNMLRESYRILKKGGKIRLVTPDINFLINIYLNPNKSIHKRYLKWMWKESTPWAPSPDPIFLFNNYVRDWGHTFIYDKKILIECMKKIGFKKIKQYRVSKSEDKNLKSLENEFRAPNGLIDLESCCLEGTK